MYKRVFIWDLDDTLIWTSYAYSRAFSKFYDYMLELFNYRLLELRTLGTISENIDKGLILTINEETGKPYGYSIERFPMSLVETYKWLCEHGYGKYHAMVARRVRLIGMEAFDPLSYKKQGLVKGAEMTLEYIKNIGDKLILVTKGDYLVQDYKIIALELERWFDEDIHIVSTKTSDFFREYALLYPDSTIYSVGNSYKSDMAPALEAGLRGIFIPYYTWLGEASEYVVDKEKVLQVDAISEIIELCNKGKI